MKKILTYALWTFRIAVVLAVAGLLHWSLPSRDIVRIVDTEVVRRGEPATDAQGNARERVVDVRQISTVRPNGRPSVYRNEDTDWGWPPYFKFDSADLSAQAANAVSTEEAPQWMIVTHYGYRIPLFSMFPNAVSIRSAEGPDQRLIPWFNIVVWIAVFGALLLIRRQVLRFFGFGKREA